MTRESRVVISAPVHTHTASPQSVYVVEPLPHLSVLDRNGSVILRNRVAAASAARPFSF